MYFFCFYNFYLTVEITSVYWAQSSTSCSLQGFLLDYDLYYTHISALNEIMELCMRNKASSCQTSKQTLTVKEGEALDLKNTLMLFQLCVSYQNCICFHSPHQYFR